MAKLKATISVILPPWPGKSDRHQWRKQILQRLNDKREQSGASFGKDARIEVDVLVHLQKRGKGALGQDVDNLLKHICDALQARRGGSKTIRRKGGLIKNDSQVFRAQIEKRYLGKRNESGGRLTVRPYRG